MKSVGISSTLRPIYKSYTDKAIFVSLILASLFFFLFFWPCFVCLLLFYKSHMTVILLNLISGNGAEVYRNGRSPRLDVQLGRLQSIYLSHSQVTPMIKFQPHVHTNITLFRCYLQQPKCPLDVVLGDHAGQNWLHAL